jgi:hypothetical protein
MKVKITWGANGVSKMVESSSAMKDGPGVYDVGPSESGAYALEADGSVRAIGREEWDRDHASPKRKAMIAAKKMAVPVDEQLSAIWDILLDRSMEGRAERIAPEIVARVKAMRSARA